MPRHSRLPLMFLALACASGAAWGQSYPGQDVSVDYTATGGSQVLLYPGGQYGRVVRPLREPGEFTGPVVLHKPSKKPRRTVAAKPAPETATPSVVAPMTTPPLAPEVASHAPKRQAALAPAKPAPTPPVRKTAEVPPPPPVREAPQTSLPTEFGDLAVARPKAARQPKTGPAKPPARLASIGPTHASAPENYGDRRGSIGFEANASDPSASAMQNINKLAIDLSNALTPPSSKIQLLAYAGPRGEKSSDARRLALRRALVVRQLLIDAGVPSDRIDVRAMGGTEDGGSTDRVDVFLKG